MIGESEDDSDCDSCIPAYLRGEATGGEWNGGVISLLGATLSFVLFLLVILAAIAILVSRFFPGFAESDGIRGIKCKSFVSIEIWSDEGYYIVAYCE